MKTLTLVIMLAFCQLSISAQTGRDLERIGFSYDHFQRSKAPPPAYATDGQWRQLSTNITNLEVKSRKARSELAALEKLNSPTAQETNRISQLRQLSGAQQQQLDAWRKDRQDIETRQKLKEKPKGH